ncbi:hypothetical protein [Arthrobacter sp. NyZ413]|uniref:hypothetical protein n=1 Tax=Arthrobacter sp. NyZ413 TaxID=3144669 RepID=UPI003BF7B9CF
MVPTPTSATTPTVSALTGHHAPASGWWRPDGDPKPYRYLHQGELIPPVNGKPVHWILVLELTPAQRWRA